MFELDHLFVWTNTGGPEADRLAAFGLTEGEPNVHPGQGTACRRFFFHNAFLELVWVSEPVEAQSDAIRHAGLWTRGTARGAQVSPFGLALRPCLPGVGEVPFAGWEYRPPYLPAPLAIYVGQDVPASEPWWFYLSFGRRPDDPGWPRAQAFEHITGFREITALRLEGPGFASPSPVARAVTRAWAVTLAESSEHMAEVIFDGGGQGKAEDFRPLLPIMFRW